LVRPDADTAGDASTLLVPPREEASNGVLPADQHLRVAVVSIDSLTPILPGTILQRAVPQRLIRQTSAVIEDVCFAVLWHSRQLMHPLVQTLGD
jgi:hypothetical protein